MLLSSREKNAFVAFSTMLPSEADGRVGYYAGYPLGYGADGKELCCGMCFDLEVGGCAVLSRVEQELPRLEHDMHSYRYYAR